MNTWKISKNLVIGLSILSAIAVLPKLAKAGGETSGGGDQKAAHFADVSKRALQSVNLICGNPDTTDENLCAMTPALSEAIKKMKVVPRERNTVLGPDGNPRDAGNDASEGGQTVFLDIDRWEDKLNERDPQKAPIAATGLVRLALHEPLVLAGTEQNDNYLVSNALIQMLKSNGIDFNFIVGKPPVAAEDPTKKQYYVKLFTGSARKGANDWGNSSCLNAAESKALSEANKAGYGHCRYVKLWTKSGFFFDNCYHTVECYRPVEN